MQEKTCSKCHVSYPATAEFFGSNKAAGDGFQYYCRPCQCAYQQQWRRAHRTQCLEGGRRYYVKHRAQADKAIMEWRSRNPEKMRAYSSAYYEKHPEKCAEAARRWASANLERCAVVARNRRARIRLAPGIHTATDIAAQFTRQHGRCYWMTTPVCRDRGGKLGDKYHVDHVIPVVRGGSNGPENLVIACPTCNRKKSAKFPHEFSDRLC